MWHTLHDTRHSIKTFASARAPVVLVLQGFEAVNEFSLAYGVAPGVPYRPWSRLDFTPGIRYLKLTSYRGTTMDLSFSDQEEAFRREVRQWLRRNVPKRQRKAEPAEFGDP